jgi:hypothetical protein
LRHAADEMVLVERHARDYAGELGATAVHDAIAIGGIGRAQNREWNSTVPEKRAGNLLAVQRVT